MESLSSLAWTWRRAEVLALRQPALLTPWALRGDRAGQHSIRINGQWRLIFVWCDDGPHEVEIVDYH